jgi:hypothetical protein
MNIVKSNRKLKWLALPLALFLIFSVGLSSVFAGSVNIRDDANLLSSDDESALRNSASRYGFDVTIVTNSNSYSNRAAFESFVRGQSSNSRNITIGLNSRSGWTVIEAGSATGISSTRASQIAGTGDSAFAQRNFRSGLETIVSGLGSASTLGTTSGSTSSSNSSGGGGFLIGFLIVGVLIAIVVVSVLIAKQRRQAPRQVPDYMQPGYNSGLNQPGYYNQPGYGPGYGPGYYRDNDGIGPVGGAVLGGVAGFALGSALSNPGPGYYGPGYVPTDGSAAGGSTWDAGGGEGIGGSDWGGGGSSDWGGGDIGGGGGFDSGGGDW